MLPFMTSRSKDNLAATFRKIFCSSGKMKYHENCVTSTLKTESPARFLRQGLQRDEIQSVHVPPESPRKFVRFFKTSRVNSCSLSSTPGTFNDSKGPPICHQHKVRAKRLMKELKEAQRLERTHPLDPSFTVELVNDNLFEWHVKLYKIDSESDLAADMRELKVKYILLHVMFPENFPFAPPFIRVISPKIDKGFVMEGGAICMELLTPRGWASGYTLEAVFMQFAASLVKGQGRILRKTKSNKTFNQRTAKESFRSLVKTHDKYGWVTPPLADG